ncbi:MAG: hypothetical protein C4311_07015 [Chloroflexota bacterium]
MSRDYDDIDDIAIYEDALSALDEEDRDASYYEYMWGGPEDEELEVYEFTDALSDMEEDNGGADYHENLSPLPLPTPQSGDKVTAVETQPRQLQWFYDDAGYYSYILLNASQEQFKQIQQTLRESGLRVLLAGRSYRPASNGVQYQWYIRVSYKSGKHPARNKIEEISAFLEAAGEKRGPGIKEPEIKDKTAELEKELEKQKGISERLAKRLGEIRVAYERVQQELQNYQERVSTLEQLLSQQTALAEDTRQYYELAIQKLSQDNQRLNQELQNRLRELDEYLRNFEPEKQELENRLAIVEKENRQLKAQIHELRSAQPQELESGNAEYLFRELLRFFLPQVEFLDGSLDTLWREMRDPLGVLRDLTRPGELKAKRVRKAEDWLERHIDSKWRLYFRKCEDSKWQVLISHKNTQNTDINWLSRQ